MLEFICSIPESIGWSMVGFVGAFALMLAVQVGKDIAQMWKEWHENEEN